MAKKVTVDTEKFTETDKKEIVKAVRDKMVQQDLERKGGGEHPPARLGHNDVPSLHRGGRGGDVGGDRRGICSRTPRPEGARGRKLLPPGRDTGRLLGEQESSLAEMIELANGVLGEEDLERRLPTALAHEMHEMLLGVPLISKEAML